MSDELAELNRLLAALRREELSSFVEGAFSVLAPGAPYLPNFHIEAISYALQLAVEGKTRRLLITLPPRHLKSVVASVCLPAWILGKAPRTRIVTASHTASLAAQHHNDCRRLIVNPYFRQLFGGCRLSRDKNTEMEFRTTAGGSRLSVSVGGPLTGRGGDFIVVDDPLKADDANSELLRRAVNEWYANTVASRLNDPKTGVIIVVMQRLHEDDLAGMLLESGGWTVLNLPAIAEEDERIQIGPHAYHVRRRGDLLHPARVPADVLDQQRRELGETGFSAQFQQRPAPREGAAFKRAWVRRYAHAPERRPGDQIVQCWDMGVKAGDKNDYSACVTVLHRGKQHYILHVIRERLEFPQLLKRVVAHRAAFGPGPLLIEDAAAGASILQALRAEPNFPRGIAVKTEGDKLDRASGQTYKFEEGNVYLPEQAPWLSDFEAELFAFPKARHDDQVDALVHYLQWSDRRYPNVPLSGGITIEV